MPLGCGNGVDSPARHGDKGAKDSEADQRDAEARLAGVGQLLEERVRPAERAAEAGAGGPAGVEAPEARTGNGRRAVERDREARHPGLLREPKEVGVREEQPVDEERQRGDRVLLVHEQRLGTELGREHGLGPAGNAHGAPERERDHRAQARRDRVHSLGRARERVHGAHGAVGAPKERRRDALDGRRHCEQGRGDVQRNRPVREEAKHEHRWRPELDDAEHRRDRRGRCCRREHHPCHAQRDGRLGSSTAAAAPALLGQFTVRVSGCTLDGILFVCFSGRLFLSFHSFVLQSFHSHAEMKKR